MIALIRGRLRRKHDDRVVIEAAGVGYEVVLPPVVQHALAGAMASDGDGAADVALEIHYHATQNQPSPVLIGFLSGLDKEFFESILVPQIILDGFLGFRPTAEGLRVDPKLPSDWPELTVNRIHLHNAVLALSATKDAITVRVEEAAAEPLPLVVQLPQGAWTVAGPAGLGIEGSQARIAATPGYECRFIRNR